jgi:hypothetical protein
MPAEIKPDLHSEDRLDHLKESIYFEWLFLELAIQLSFQFKHYCKRFRMHPVCVGKSNCVTSKFSTFNGFLSEPTRGSAVYKD